MTPPAPVHSGNFAGGGGHMPAVQPRPQGTARGLGLFCRKRATPIPRLGNALTGGGARATSAPRGRRGGAWGGGPG